MDSQAIIILIVAGMGWIVERLIYNYKRRKRRTYYRNVYLKSNDWKRKRYVVLKRDNWKCKYCGKRATEVHHLKYARRIGKEPIKWLVSICNSCHDKRH